MQNREHVNFRERTLYYLSQAIARQGEKGTGWQFDLKAVYGVFFLNFRLSDLPDTEGKTVKLTLKYKSFSGEKSIQFDYCSRKAAGSTNIAEKPAYSSRVK